MTPGAGPLRIAVAGAGNRATGHLRAIAAMPGYWRLAGVCDVREERAQAAGKQFGAPAFTHPLELLDATRPDALFVIVPPDGHHPLAIAAAERGVHVITEVPISISLPLADLMIEACARHNVVLEVAENAWRRPRERVRQEAIRRGAIGSSEIARMTYPGGSYHGISVVRAPLPGRPAQVQGWRHDLATLPYEDFTGLVLTTHDWELGVYRWPQELTLLYECPPRPGGMNGWEIIGSRGRTSGDDVSVAELDGRRARERVVPMRRETTMVGGVEVLARIVLPLDEPVVWENPLAHLSIPDRPANDGQLVDALQLFGFYRSIMEGAPQEYDGAAGRIDLEMLVALRESARNGSVAVPLPLVEVTDHERALHETYRCTYGHDPVQEWRAAIAKLYPRGGITHGVVTASPAIPGKHTVIEG